MIFERNSFLINFGAHRQTQPLAVRLLLLFFCLCHLYRPFCFLCFLPNSEALKMRIRKLGLERTSVCDLTRPPSLVYDTAETMPCNSNENYNSVEHNLLQFYERTKTSSRGSTAKQWQDRHMRNWRQFVAFPQFSHTQTGNKWLDMKQKTTVIQEKSNVALSYSIAPLFHRR